MKKPLDLIKKTIRILNSVSYENYSDGKVKTYLKYMDGSRADEDKLTSPILLRKFLTEILGFRLGKTIATQELKGIGKPDYIPIDTRTHPFVFDAKGTNTQYLSHHYPQIKKYIKSPIKYGILTNMRDLNVYTSMERVKIEKYNFNFVKLYQDYKQNPKACSEKENTKRFLNFVESFSYKLLTKEEKIERIAKAKPWTGKEELNVKSLTDQLKHIVNILRDDVKEQKSELLSMAGAGSVPAKSIAYEIEEICAHISGREMKEVNAGAFNKIMNAEETTLYEKARDAFFRRVAYFAMTRLLLARVWEDIGFIEEQCLYNGGFAKWYENFGHEIRRVLSYAFGLAAERYPWLFDTKNNYSWYKPSANAIIDSLYGLSNFYLGKLDQDILGTIYEDYIEKIDKKNKGQYYTPREIVSFIWNRVGYTNPKAFFWHTEGRRRPNFILDPATGSGGFLVEAARRIRECPEFDWSEPKDLEDIHNAILWGIFGSEIAPFPYYLTQVNLLIQLTPVIRRILKLTGKKPREEPTPLGVICIDSMKLHNPEAQLLPQKIKKRKEEYRHEILRFTIAEEKICEKVKDKYVGKFSYCCANPPYIGEKGHKDLFRQTLNSYPYWKKYYQGKMDYLHWFIILGLSKLRQWGKLGFITSAYWPTADGALKLRKYILENAKIKEMIFFEEVKIFEHAKGQRSMVFVLTKCSGEEHKEERENNHIKIIIVKCENQNLPGKTIRENLDSLTKHIQKYINRPRYEDEHIKIFWSGIKQGELPKNGGPWNEILIDRSFKGIALKIKQDSIPLQEVLDTKQGIVPGVDRITRENIRILPQHFINERGIKVGDGIFVLTHDEANQIISSPDKYELLVPSYRNSHIASYYVDTPSSEREYLIYIDREVNLDKYPEIKFHLTKYKEILEARLTRYEERGYKELYPWYRLNRPRDRKMLSSEKIVVSNWGTDWQPFAYQIGKFFEKRDITLFVKKSGVKESLFYFLGILNSALIRYWMEGKVKQVGYMRQGLQEQIPIHRINFDGPKEIRVHDEIVDKVKSIREKIAELAKYSKYFSGCRLTRLQFDAPLPQVNNEAIIKSLAPKNLRNLRTHSQIKIEKPKDFKGEEFYLSRTDKPELVLTGNTQLKLTGKDKSSIFITGPFEVLELLTDILPDWKDKSWNEIKENILLPDIIISFNMQKTKILNKVRDIRAEILQLQKDIDQIAYKLYGLTKEEIKIVAEIVKR